MGNFHPSACVSKVESSRHRELAIASRAGGHEGDSMVSAACWPVTLADPVGRVLLPWDTYGRARDAGQW